MAFKGQKADSESLRSWDGTYRGSEYHKLSPGQWTDDTVMSKLLAESLMSCGGFFPRDVADRYLVWFKSGDLHGIGKTTKKALERLASGVSWRESGVKNAKDNGAAMRAAPIGLFYQEDLCTVKEFARLDTRITHLSEDAELGSIAMALGVALLATGKASPKTLPQQVVEHLPLRSHIRMDVPNVPKALLFVQSCIDQGTDLTSTLNGTGTGAIVNQSVPAAFAAFSLTHSFLEAVESAVRAGGDANTVASMAGALAGTYYGFEAIPKLHTLGLEGFKHFRRVERKLVSGPRTDILWALDRKPIWQVTE
jgi:ADP-ribosylglycohydrolase